MTEADTKLYGDVKHAMGMVESIGIPAVYNDLNNFMKYLEGKYEKKPDMMRAWTSAAIIAYCKDDSTPEVFVKKTLESCLYYGKSVTESEYAEF